MESTLVNASASSLGVTSGGGTSYKEYLRSQFIYKDFKDLNLKSFSALVSVKLTSLTKIYLF